MNARDKNRKKERGEWRKRDDQREKSMKRSERVVILLKIFRDRLYHMTSNFRNTSENT